MKKITLVLALVLGLAVAGFAKTDSTAVGTKKVATAKVVKAHKKAHKTKKVAPVKKDTVAVKPTSTLK